MNQKSRAENLEEEEEECQTVEVHGVDSPEVAEIIVGLMKNQKKGGGEIERESLDEKRGILTMLFQDKKSKMRFLKEVIFCRITCTFNICTEPCKKTTQWNVTIYHI